MTRIRPMTAASMRAGFSKLGKTVSRFLDCLLDGSEGACKLNNSKDLNANLALSNNTLAEDNKSLLFSNDKSPARLTKK